MPINDIVNVQITAQTQSVSQPGFGQLLLVGLFKNWTDLIRMYSNMQGVANDFEPDQPEYTAAQDFFSQPVVPPQLWIGRRTIDTAVISLETAMAAFNYTTQVNSNVYTVAATNNSLVSFSTTFITGNFATVTVNGSAVNGLTSVVNFSANFVSSNSITATVNGIALSPVSFTTNQATTIAAVATTIAGASGVASATVTATDQITVVFSSLSASSVNSVITTGGVSQPTAAIISGTPFTTDSATTVGLIAASIASNANVLSATVQSGNLSILVLGITATLPATNAVAAVNITGGDSQPISITTNQVSVIPQMITAMTADPTVTASQTSTTTYTLVSQIAGTPWTLDVSTNIINPVKCQIQITQAIPGTTYQVTVNGTQYQYPVQGSSSLPENTTSEQIAAGLVSVINSDDNAIVTATDNMNGTFDLASNATPQIAFSVFVTQKVMAISIGLVIQPYNTSTSIATDLTALNNYNSNWYGLALTDRTQATVLEAAAWTESNSKLFGTASSDPDIINLSPGADTSSVAYQLALAGYIRTWLLYNQDAGDNQLPTSSLDYPECAWFGTMLWQNPGSNTWALKQLISTPYSDLTTTQSQNARGKYANTYEYIAGVGVTRDGKVSGNEYIDIVIGIDWLTSTVQTYVYSVLVNNPKVPYTDAGITAIQSQIERALDQGVNQNFIAPNSYQVFVPKAVNISPTDKTNRVLNGVTFQAVLAGAVQAINITGTLSF